MRSASLLVAACIWVVAASGHAADQPISGAKLLLLQSGGEEKLVFVSRDPAFLFPTIAGADDPGSGTPGGLQVDLISPLEPMGVSLVAPVGAGTPGWTATAGAVPSHRFRNAAAPDTLSPLKVVVLKQGRVLKIIGRSTGLALTVPQGSVGVRIVTGSLRSCARFDASTMRRDEAGRVVARAASAAGVADCSNASLGGANPVCGDGVQNQSSEQCDGTDFDFQSCGPLNVCRPAGFPGECQCCSDGGPLMSPEFCCNPSFIWLAQPEGGSCHATRCDPPWPCSGTDVCQPDGSCCAPLGGVCRRSIGSQSLGPCCAGLECRTFDGFGNGACCVSDGGSCTSDGECCTSHCTPGGTCEACRAGGAACASPYECCSLSCSGGTCDACGPNGAFCFDGATCCGGLYCNPITSRCYCGPSGAQCFADAGCCSGTCNSVTQTCD